MRARIAPKRKVVTCDSEPSVRGQVAACDRRVGMKVGFLTEAVRTCARVLVRYQSRYDAWAAQPHRHAECHSQRLPTAKKDIADICYLEAIAPDGAEW